jgi:8-oxo-dGTP diphosphatase
MPIREIAIAVILDTQGHYLFQRRDNIPGIAHPGKVSLFGGHREPGETYLQCVVREVQEEIGYPVLPEDAEYLTNLDGAGDIVDGDLVRGEVFVLRDVPSDNLAVTEGSLTIVEPDRLVELEPEFTPATRYALGAFLRTSQHAPFQNPIGQGVAPAPSNASQSYAQSPTTSAPPGSPTAAQAQRNAGAANGNQDNSQTTTGQASTPSSPSAGAVGHAANGKPIGSTGSGPGSPEMPIDSGSR